MMELPKVVAVLVDAAGRHSLVRQDRCWWLKVSNGGKLVIDQRISETQAQRWKSYCASRGGEVREA